MNRDTVEVKTTIQDWLRENVGTKGDLSHDYPLIENGLLTSLQTMELVMFMEGEFGITVDDEDIVEENFATLGDIVALVENKGE
jgi:acyl carrier protein